MGGSVSLIAENASRRRLRGWAALSHASVFAALWWALTGGAADSWLVGVPSVLAATVASQLLWRRHTGWWSPLALLRFVVFFLRESMRGGVDVARRALHPDLPLRPALVRLESRLPPGPPEVFLMNALSLMPGTLGVELRGTALTLHVLDEQSPVVEETRRLEALIAAMFRIPLASAGQDA
jgi:multicomponent Na+:H+ antiporter subunit E